MQQDKKVKSLVVREKRNFQLLLREMDCVNDLNNNQALSKLLSVFQSMLLELSSIMKK